MGSTNYGNQSLTFDYNQEAASKLFNALNYKLTPKGIYEGFILERISDTTLRIKPDAITGKGTIFIQDSSQGVGVRVEVDQNIDLVVSSASPERYVVLRFTWSDAVTNYMDVLTVTYANIVDDDIILGQYIYDGSVLRSTFDLTRRCNFYLKGVKDRSSYFKVTPSEPASTTIAISSGQIITPVGFINVSGTTLVCPATNNGRNDIIWVDRNGVIQLTQGVDSGSPTTPTYGDKKVIAEIRRTGAFSVVTGDKIVPVATDFSLAPGAEDTLLTNTTSFTPGISINGAFQSIATGVFTFNGLKTFSSLATFSKGISVIGEAGQSIALFKNSAGITKVSVDLNGYLKTSEQIHITPITSGTASFEVGSGRTADGASVIDLIGDTTYSDFGLRLIRNSSANANSELIHRGSGALSLFTSDSAPIVFNTNSTERMRITSSGSVLVGTATSTGEKFQVAGIVSSTEAFWKNNLTTGSDIFAPDYGGRVLGSYKAYGLQLSTENHLDFWMGNTVDNVINRMRLTYGGNLLIGTTDNSNNRKLYISASGQTVLAAMGGSGYLLVDNVGSGQNYYSANDFHAFLGGNVLIGKTTIASYGKLQVRDSLSISGSGDTSSIYLRVEDDTASTIQAINLSTDVKLNLNLNPFGGNVIIGNSTSQTLAVKTGSDFTGLALFRANIQIGTSSVYYIAPNGNSVFNQVTANTVLGSTIVAQNGVSAQTYNSYTLATGTGANTIALRDGAGRLQSGSPVNGIDVTTKDWVEGLVEDNKLEIKTVEKVVSLTGAFEYTQNISIGFVPTAILDFRAKQSGGTGDYAILSMSNIKSFTFGGTSIDVTFSVGSSSTTIVKILVTVAGRPLS